MIAALASKPERLIIGIMSGTSADGVDAALVRVRGSGETLAWRLLRHETLEYSLKVRDLILRSSEPGSGDTASLCRLNVLLGELFARAAAHVAGLAGDRHRGGCQPHGHPGQRRSGARPGIRHRSRKHGHRRPRAAHQRRARGVRPRWAPCPERDDPPRDPRPPPGALLPQVAAT